jgi:hypothetical protein
MRPIHTTLRFVTLAGLLLAGCMSAGTDRHTTPGGTGGATGGTSGSGGTGGSASGGSGGGSGGTIGGGSGGSGGSTGGSSGSGGAPGSGGSGGSGDTGGSGGSSVDAGAVADGGAAPSDGGGVTPPTGGPYKVVLITGDEHADDDSKLKMIEILKEMKATHNVDLEMADAANVKAADMMGKSLLIAGPNTTYCGNKPDAAFKALPVPIMVSKDCNTTDFGIGTMHNTGGTNLKTITIINADHPLAAGFPLGPVTVFTVGARLVRGGDLGSGAIKIATTPEGADSTWGIFAYEKGGMLPGNVPAPAKRMGFFWHRPPNVTAEGKKLFVAAVAWMISP